MESITNRFSALAVDGGDTPRERSNTPSYPPTPLTAAEVAYVRRLDSEIKGFRSWDSAGSVSGGSGSGSGSGNIGSIFGGNRQRQSRTATTVICDEDIKTSEGKYRPPAIRQAITEAKKNAPIDSSSIEQFPSLGGPKPAAPKAWTSGSASETFAKKVADLAERERNDELMRKIDAENEERRRKRETIVIPMYSRFSRPLEDVLTEDQHDEHGFEDDHYEPNISYDQDEN
jgi:hypothetical protein